MERELTPQKVGAFGERAVEAELLRRGWLPANVNPTVKNAADYDIFAFKPTVQVLLRVKTCGPTQPGFQFGGFKGEIQTEGFARHDFTILVRMGHDRSDDQFYVVPTRVVREQLKKHRDHYLGVRRRDGNPRDVRNLWQEPRFCVWNAEKKDNLEDVMQGMACAGETSLDKAQDGFRRNWAVAYRKFVPGQSKKQTATGQKAK